MKQIEIISLLILKNEIKNLESIFVFNKKLPLSDGYQNIFLKTSILKLLKSKYKELQKIENNNVMPAGIFITPCLDERIKTLDYQIKKLIESMEEV